MQCDLKGFHIPGVPGRRDSAAWMLLVCAHSVSVGSFPEGRSPAQPTSAATEPQTLFDGGTHGVSRVLSRGGGPGQWGKWAHRRARKGDTCVKEQCLALICLENHTVGHTGQPAVSAPRRTGGDKTAGQIATPEPLQQCQPAASQEHSQVCDMALSG